MTTRFFPSPSPMPLLPIGARAYCDGRDEVIVRQTFPEGSSSYLWPHYKVCFEAQNHFIYHRATLHELGATGNRRV